MLINPLKTGEIKILKKNCFSNQRGRTAVPKIFFFDIISCKKKIIKPLKSYILPCPIKKNKKFK